LDADFFRTLYDYGYWARDRLLTVADGLSEADYARPNGFTYGSIRGILTHVLGSEASYLRRWMADETVESFTEADMPDLATLGQRWQAHESKMRRYLASLTDADLNTEIVSRRRTGEEVRRPLWHDLIQIVNHGTQHRSEAAEALTMIGRSPGNLDISVFLQQQAARTA
jgi:uncharacterized damage-inducible protein DinB